MAAEPSRHPNARHFGKRLPAFLARTESWSETPWLAELAALEWAMSEVFQDRDAPGIGLEAMAALHPQDWPRLRFRFAPHVRRLAASHGGPEVWLALNAGEDPTAAAAEGKADPSAQWLVWRQGEKANFRMLDAPEAWAFDEAASGADFEGLCEGLLSWSSPETAASQAASFLHNWITAGIVAAYSVGEGSDAGF